MTAGYAEFNLQQLEAEVEQLQAYIDKHESLIANGPETIRKLQEECDRWRVAVTDLCAFANVTVAQIIEAGLRVHIETED